MLSRPQSLEDVSSLTIRRLALVIAGLAIVLALARVTINSQAALAYSCPAGFHCIADYDWYGGPINGAETTVDVVHVSCSISSCSQANSFVDNELWDYQIHTSQCSGQCRIEAGYTTGNYDSSIHTADVLYFWEELKPNSTPMVHVYGFVPGQDFGHKATIKIYAECCNAFNVEIDGYSQSWYATSTNNTMAVNDINIGQELAGSSGSTAPTAYFTNNIWIDRSGNSHYQYQDGNGIQQQGGPPPHLVVAVPPRLSPTGGSMYTYCC